MSGPTPVPAVTREQEGPIVVRFWSKVDKAGPVPPKRPELGPCWVWTAPLRFGYGQFWVSKARGRVMAHRFAYETVVGPVPKGLVLDHLCRNEACVNPTHLEPVTQKENLLRGETVNARGARTTHCPHGHPYDEANTIHRRDGSRQCRSCKADYMRRYERTRPVRASHG